MFSFFRKRAQPSPAPPLVEESAPRFKLSVALATDVGCVRELNEDSVRVAHPPDESQSDKGVLIIVADGMGGHAAGEVASQTAIDEVPARYFGSAKATDAALREAVEGANGAIYQMGKSNAEMAGMGTTFTGLLIRGDKAWCAHVGDSRLYLVRGGAIYQMSEDHSAVGELVKRGLIQASEVRGHPQGNIILRALGTQPKVEVALWDEPFPLRNRDVWVLCSDGLSDLVEESDILSDVTQFDGEAAGQKLIERAKVAGGHDNISVILVEIAAVGVGVGSDAAENTPAPEKVAAKVTREATTVVEPVVTREVNHS